MQAASSFLSSVNRVPRVLLAAVGLASILLSTSTSYALDAITTRVVQVGTMSDKQQSGPYLQLKLEHPIANHECGGGATYFVKLDAGTAGSEKMAMIASLATTAMLAKKTVIVGYKAVGGDCVRSEPELLTLTLVD